MFIAKNHSLARRVLLSCLFAACAVSASAGWLPFSKKSSRLTSADNFPLPEMIQSDKGVSGMEITYKFPGAAVSTINEDNQDYTLLKIDNFGLLNETGKPALPYRIYTFAIPQNSNASVEIEKAISTNKENILIAPALPPASDKVGAPEPEFTINKEFYEKDILYPEKAVSIIDTRIYRGIKLARVRVCPVQYNPAKRSALLHSEIDFTIKFNGNRESVRITNKENVILKNIIANPAVTSLDRAIDASTNGKLLIITTDEFKSAADSLVLWKKQMGYDVFLSSKASWTNYNEVKDTAHYYGINENIDFLTIIGDNDDVPAYYSTLGSYSHVTDLYLGCLDGPSDIVPEFGLGRISVSNSTEAMNTVTKIINYERNPVNDSSFYTSGISAAYFQHAGSGYAERRFAQTSWEIRGYLINEQNYSVDRVFYTSSSTSPLYWNNGYYSNGEPLPDSLKRPACSWNGNSTMINNALDDGRFLLFHRDHGEESGWGDPHYNISNVNTLSNGNKTPIVFSINCLTGKFNHSSPCFAESFLRHSNGGAAGVVAATEISYSGCNDGLAEGLIDAIWPNPGLVPLFPHNQNPVVTQHDPIHEMGNVVIQGKLRMSETWHSSSPPFDNEKYTYELFHYFGDASTRIWTKVPEVVNATHAGALLIGQNSFIISSISTDSGIATIMMNNEVIGRGEIINGTATINIDTPPITTGDATITITGYNLRPYQATIPVVPGGPTILAITPEASSLFDVGETVNITWQTFVPESIPNVRIEFSSDSGTTFSIIESSILNNNSYSFSASAISSDACLFRISSADGSYPELTQLFSIHDLSIISGSITGGLQGEITYTGPTSGSIQTDASGDFSLSRMLPGTYSLTATVETDASYSSVTQDVTVPPDQINLQFNIDYPSIGISDIQVDDTVPSGGTSNKNFTIENSGDGILHCKLQGGGGNGSIVINEVCSNPDFIEIWNSGPQRDISGWQLSWQDNVNSSGTYTFPAGTIINNGSRFTIQENSGTGNDTTFYTGTSIAWSTAFEVSVALLDNSGNGIDFMRTSGSTTVPPSPLSWYGTGVSSSSISMYRHKDSDSDSTNDWLNSSNHSMGLINPGQTGAVESQWYSLSSDSLNIASGTNSSISINFDANGLVGGVYRDTVKIYHDDPSQNNPINLALNMTVTGIKRLSTTQDSLNFDSLWIGVDSTVLLRLENTGSDSTQITALNFRGNSFRTSALPISIPPFGYYDLPVTCNLSQAGAVIDTLTINSNASDFPVIDITLLAVGGTPPEISLSHTIIGDTIVTDSLSSKLFNLSNSGGNRLRCSLKGGGGTNEIIINEVSCTPDFIELWNKGAEKDLSGWQISWIDDASTTNSYTLPTGTIIRAGGRLTVHEFSGTNNDSTIYCGLSMGWVSSTQLSVSLLDSNNIGIDFMKTSGSSTLPPEPTVWHGPGISRSSDIIYRNSDIDSDSASDWSNNNTPTAGLLNPGQIGNTQPAWYSLSTDTLDVATGGTEPVVVNFNSANLVGGVYNDTISILHNSPLQTNPWKLPVRLNVIGISRLSTDTNSLAFGTVWNGGSYTEFITLQNSGSDTTTIDSLVFGNVVFSTSLSAPFKVAPFSTTTLPVTFQPVQLGSVTDTLTIYSNASDNSIIKVSLEGLATVPPALQVSPSFLADTLLPPDSVNKYIYIHNSGGDTLQYSIGVATETEDRSNMKPDVISEESEGILDSEKYIRPQYENTEAVPFPYYSGFEDGSLVDWPITSGKATATIDTIARRGQHSLAISGTGSHYEGARLAFETSVTPEFVSFSVRSQDSTEADGYFVLGEDGSTAIFFIMHSTGVLYANDYTTYEYSANTWYDILFHIDWTNRTFDMYVNDSLVFDNEPFRNTVNSISSVHVYNHDSSVAWYDNISISNDKAPGWLMLSGTENSVAPGDTDTLDVMLRSEGLNAGLYTSNIEVTSNAPVNGNVSIPCSLTVEGIKYLSAADSAIDFGAVWLSRSSIVNLSITNSGNDTTTIDSLIFGNSSFSLSLSAPIKVGPFSTTVLPVTFQPIQLGLTTDTLTIYSNASDNSIIKVSLEGLAIEPPTLLVSPTFIADTLLPSDSINKFIYISNNGGDTLQYSLDVVMDATEAEDRSFMTPDSISEECEGILDSDKYTKPEYDNSDAVSFPYYSGFEDSSLVDWPITSAEATSSIDKIAKKGQYSLAISGTGSHYNGARLAFDTSVTPEFVSFSVRSQDSTKSDGYFILGEDGSTAIFFFMRSSGVFYANDYSTYQYSPNTWYDILFHIDWANHNFDMYVNDSLVFNNEPFRDNVNSISSVHLYNHDSSIAWYDNISISNNDALAWLTVSDVSNVVAPGNTDTIDVTLRSEGLNAGLYTSTIGITSNAPINSSASIPCSLTVEGVKLLSAADSAIDFGTVWQGNDSVIALTLTNDGNDTTTISTISFSSNEYSSDTITTLKIPPFSSRALNIHFLPSSIGSHPGNLILQSDASDNPIIEIGLAGECVLGPKISIDPTSINDAVFEGDSSTTAVTISNNGDANLTFNISIANESSDAKGGPDAFGYHWKDSDELSGIPFIWEDISLSGNSLSISTMDDSYSQVSLSYDFPFYDSLYNTMYVSSNGFICFGSSTGASSLSNTMLPSSATPNGLIAALWDDLDPGEGGNVYFQDFGTYSIVQFEQVRHNSTSYTGTYTFQYVLHRSGKINLYYKDVSSAYITSATVGIENQAGNAGLQVVYNSSYLHDSLAIEFRSTPSWLSTSVANGVLSPQTSSQFDVKMNAADLEPGTYFGAVLIQSNDYSVATQYVLCTLTVNPLPVPTVSFNYSDTVIQETQGTSSISLSLDFPINKDVTIPYTISGTASSADHNLVSGTLTILAGRDSASINYTIVNDTIDESDETIIITLGTPVNANLPTITSDTILLIDDEHILNVVSMGNGTVSPLGNTVVTSSEPFSILAIPNSGYIFDSWMVLNGTVDFTSGNIPSTEVIVTGGDATVAASFTREATIAVDSIDATAEVFLSPSGSCPGAKKLVGAGHIGGLRSGTYWLKIVCSKYRTEYFPIALTSGDTTHINIPLRPEAAIIADKPDTIKVDDIAVQVGSIVSAVNSDIDNDGDLDLIVGTSYGDIDLYEKVDNLYSSPVTILQVDPTLSCIRIADVDNDMRSDIIVSYSDKTFLNIFKEVQSRQYTLSSSNIPLNSTVSSFEVIHNDDIGDLDFIVCSPEGGLVYYMNPNIAAESYPLLNEDSSAISTSYNSGIVSLDINGNGRNDLLLADANGNVVWYESNANHTFSLRNNFNCNGAPMQIQGAATISTFNSNPGEFPSLLVSDSYGTLYIYPGLLRGDINRDGVVDILDLQIFGVNWGKTDTDVNWLPEPNLNVDADIFTGQQTINSLDLQILGNSWGAIK